MPPHPAADVYSPREIARAAGVAEGDAVAVIGRADALLPWADAIRVTRALARGDRAAAMAAAPRPLFAAADGGSHAAVGVPIALSSSLHVGAVAAFIWMMTLVAPRAAMLVPDERVPVRLVFLTIPGRGGGGGGGGLQEKIPPATVQRQGARKVSSPLPEQPAPRPLSPPEPKPLSAEQLPVVVAPLAAIPADPRNRAGVLDARTAVDSHGPGHGGGAGTGAGTGLGEGTGSGVGPGSGGGTGGGPYRPGSGVEPPRLLREIKADYTDAARRRGIEGDVVLEIVVRSDGSVGDVRMLQGLDPGLNDRAAAAVRQWRFAPARRLNAPVDVIVEVAVEFRLR